VFVISTIILLVICSASPYSKYLLLFFYNLQLAYLAWNIKHVVGTSAVMTLELPKIVVVPVIVDVSVVMELY